MLSVCVFLWRFVIFFLCFFFFCKQKTAYEMRISDWSSDVCSSDLVGDRRHRRRSRTQQREAAESEAKTVTEVRADEIFPHPDSPAGGNHRGDVTLVEFVDYSCPYCRRMVPVMAAAEVADPGLRVVYKEFPIIGAGSSYAARAALAAHRQVRYFAFHQTLMRLPGAVDEVSVLTAAAEVGLDLDRLKADKNEPAVRAASDRNLEQARALRISGAPSFVVGVEIVRGAVELAALQEAIAKAREGPAGARPEPGGG